MVVEKVTIMKGAKAGSGIQPAGFARSSSKQAGRNKHVSAATVQIEQALRFGKIFFKRFLLINYMFNERSVFHLFWPFSQIN